ncbi:MAG: GntR family transcriptional regulator [Chloroflexi bacterium]|nr:GntR family transcriptional regulator [Chloroflexota bacterium]
MASPVYLQLKEAIIHNIQDGTYQPGDKLPSETDLIKTWSVSRITVRNAIKELIRDGLVYSVQGKGTFIAEPKITNTLPGLTSMSHDIVRRGMRPGSRTIHLEILEADKNVAARLRISPGNLVIHFERITFADDIPVAIAYTYVPVAAVAPHQESFTRETLDNKSFYEHLKAIGVMPARGDQIIAASVADPAQALILDVEPGFPLIDSERVAYTANGDCVEFTRMVARPDYIQWKVSLGPP